MKTYITTLVCHQSQKKSRLDNGDGLATYLEAMEISTYRQHTGREEDQNQQGEGLWKQRDKNWDGSLERWQLEITQNGGKY